MKRKILTLKKGNLLTKLVLIVALIAGGSSSVWADTVIFDGSVASGWEYKNSLGASVSPTNNNLYDSGGYGTPKTYSSTGLFHISTGETIKISTKRASTSLLPSIKAKISEDNGSSWTEIVNLAESQIKSDYSDVIVDDDRLVGSHIIQFELQNVYINSIILISAPTTPVLSITHPTEGDGFGFVKENATKSFSVQNTGTGSMDVVISSSDPAFSVSTNSLTGITNDGIGKSFDVTFNYDASSPGQHSANITVTPSYEGVSAQSILVTAGPDIEFDESRTTTWTTGSGKSVYVKYNANNGWNTISLPIAPNIYKTQLFGSGATVKAYALSSYDNNGTLTFETTSYMGAGTPYLVYVENAASSPFIVENINVGYTTASKVTKNSATFQGTFAPLNMEGKFGVTSSGQVMEGTSTADIKGYRAYFTGISAPSDGTRPTIVFEDDAEAQGLSAVMWMENTKEAYNLQGQKVEKGRKGIYIVNGRKVVIK